MHLYVRAPFDNRSCLLSYISMFKLLHFPLSGGTQYRDVLGVCKFFIYRWYAVSHIFG
jgi:hypothetical protein